MELALKVAEAVHVLNHDTQSCNRVAANQWLVQFQQNHAAWDVATAILTSDRHHPLASNFEVEFFAAQILKRKVLSLTISILVHDNSLVSCCSMVVTHLDFNFIVEVFWFCFLLCICELNVPYFHIYFFFSFVDFLHLSLVLEVTCFSYEAQFCVLLMFLAL